MVETSAGRFSTTMKMLSVKTQAEKHYKQKNTTGLRNVAVEGLVLDSDVLDNLRVEQVGSFYVVVSAIVIGVNIILIDSSNYNFLNFQNSLILNNSYIKPIIFISFSIPVSLI